ncbi:hypothetical protein Vadar_017533 [Vaccinium darrowii]|uniref:Uncharacterized protein n=1 Tax=Vaccinium darrowii TaxID=229202 RepID=A0ACB7ZKU0_9ERIC|nr:hypothetical protein Vadar_017533 [Vaccinium darrowii]
MAIAKTNGMWIDNMKLFVKEACFSHKDNLQHQKLPCFSSGFMENSRKGEFRGGDNHQREEVKGDKTMDGQSKGDTRENNAFVRGKSFAQVVSGNNRILEHNHHSFVNSLPIKITPAGNDWLFRGAVAHLHSLIPVDKLQEELHKARVQGTQIRAMGGRMVLITFEEKEIRDELIKNHWMNRWFDVIKPWNGEAPSIERYTWINCSGVPLQAWCVNTFKMIAERWGFFVSVDEQTSNFSSFANGRILIATRETSKIDSWVQLEIDGAIYDVKVQEEVLNSLPLVNAADVVNLGETGSNSKVEDDDLAASLVDTAEVAMGDKLDNFCLEERDNNVEAFGEGLRQVENNDVIRFPVEVIANGQNSNEVEVVPESSDSRVIESIIPDFVQNEGFLCGPSLDANVGLSDGPKSMNSSGDSSIQNRGNKIFKRKGTRNKDEEGSPVNKQDLG